MPTLRSLIACILSAGVVAAEESKPLWLAVGNGDMVKPLEPLAEKRRGEGFDTVVSTESIEKALAMAPRRPEFLLLVGDDEPGRENEPWYLPARRMKLYRWRAVQREEFASDAAWGDVDGDLVPEMAVGRIPARTPRQVELVVEKILEFERRPPTVDDLQLPIWGGSAEYGPMIDVMATQMLLMMVQAEAPDWAEPWIISGNPRHPLCGWPPDHPALFNRQIRRGGALAVLMGHADADSFLSMTFGRQQIWYTAAAAEAAMSQGPPTPPMVIFSCNSGHFNRPTPCMAEAFFFFPGGPVATIAATTESHPLTNYFTSDSLLRGLAESPPRLGTLWLSAQRRAMKMQDFLAERVLRDVEGKLEEEIDVEKLRRDQMLMYALLGDPATRLRLPKLLKATVERTDDAWRWQAERPPGATRLQVGYRSTEKIAVQWQSGPTGAEKARADFEAANARLGFVPLPSPPEDGPWEGTVDRPGKVRLVATGGEEVYVAVLELK
ncbi:MAG TPA: C25 family cysteine peptidase [Thermoguttaceae bacterium]|nr:C25 family cysteine peptidase [Thermoguttaceae bacterium]